MHNNYYKALFILLITLFNVSYVYANEQSHEATISEIDNPNIYDIDINWDSMRFSFIEQEKYIYDETNHTYSRSTQKYWTSTDNNIKVKNKSLKNINISLKYESLNNNITGNFSQNNFNIKPSEAQSIKLNLAGNLDASHNEYKTIGNISIVVS